MGVLGCCQEEYQMISKFQRRGSFALKVKVILQVKSRQTVAFVIVTSLRCDRIAVCIFQCHQFSCNSSLFYCCLATKTLTVSFPIFSSLLISSVERIILMLISCVELTYQNKSYLLSFLFMNFACIWSSLVQNLKILRAKTDI